MRSGDVTKIGFVCDLDDLPSIFQGRIPISDSPILTEGGGKSTSLLVAYALTPSPMAYLGLASDAMILHTINWKSVVRNENHWQGWRQTGIAPHSSIQTKQDLPAEENYAEGLERRNSFPDHGVYSYQRKFRCRYRGRHGSSPNSYAVNYAMKYLTEHDILGGIEVVITKLVVQISPYDCQRV